MQRYKDSKTPHIRAIQEYIILIGVAMSSNRQTITYGDVGTKMGYSGPHRGQNAEKCRHPIFCWCKVNGLPWLSAIMINQETGKPGFEFPGEDLFTLQQEVWKHDWYSHTPPTVEELAAAVEVVKAEEAEAA